MLALFLAALACSRADLIDTPPPQPSPTGGAPEAWLSVFFTNPVETRTASYRGGPDQALAEAIDQARLSVDVAAYDLDLWSLRDALIAAHRRGVQVRLATESDYLVDTPEMQQLIDAGLPVLGDRREGLMHNKFVIIDRLEVWTGSMNFTVNGAYRNNNNLLRLRASRLAEDYLVEFEEMFVDDRFGPGSPANTPYPAVTVDGTLVEVYFSPDDGVAAHLVDLVAQAQESVYFLAYSFTADELAQALIERAQAGVTVAGVLDAGQAASNTGGEYENLLAAGLDVRLDGIDGRMHHKVLIIDRVIVVTGSYNFSRSAEERNDENTLIIHDPQVAAQFIGEYDRVYAQAK